MRIRTLFPLLPALLLATATLHAQTFDLAAIHLTPPGQSSGFIKPLDGGLGYQARNISIQLAISVAWEIPERQIEAAPAWLAADHYDIEARTETAHTREQLHAMLRALLAERFGLRVHTVTREGSVYALTIDKAGVRMKLSTAPPDMNIPITWGGAGIAVGAHVPMKYLCWWLGQQLHEGRPVLDHTSLTGAYDFTLTFAPPLPPDAVPAPEMRDRPSLATALREQLGLHLDTQKGPIDYLVIDHVERPSAN